MQEDGPSAGFTLMETLIALVIFVAGYLLIHQSVSLSWHGAMVAHSEKEALRLARTRLAVAGVETRLEEGQQMGQTSDGYRWTISVRRYNQLAAADSGPAPLAGYWVTIDVRWSEGALRRARSLQLTTVKLGSRQ
jgi:prepilin-type N-terminal cleavage/methylation domain-containing protein